MLTGLNYRPLGGHLLPAINTAISDLTVATGKGVLSYPGIETEIGQTAITYTDNSKTITSIAEDKLSFVVSANTNLFVGQCIKLGETQVCVITGISGTTINVDRLIISTVVATGKVEESKYYSVYRMDQDAKSTNSTINDWFKYTKYFYIEIKEIASFGQLDLVFFNSINISDYYCGINISTKPISMIKTNANNNVTIYVFKPF